MKLFRACHDVELDGLRLVETVEDQAEPVNRVRVVDVGVRGKLSRLAFLAELEEAKKRALKGGRR